jgi:antitoxin (DNA-binding transcriptional repressor) of toxin-antitoxin stability system
MRRALKIGAFEARIKLGRLLDRVEAGEEIVIARRRNGGASAQGFSFDRRDRQ